MATQENGYCGYKRKETEASRKLNIYDFHGHEDNSRSKRRIIEISSHEDEDEGEHRTGPLRQTHTLGTTTQSSKSGPNAVKPAASVDHDETKGSIQHLLSSPPDLFSQSLRDQSYHRPPDNLDSRLISTNPVTKQLCHDDYTVGWICALPIEMMAAKAMLDEFHLPLSNAARDDNAYQLGAIAGHNVVITCVRHGVYGTTSATATAIAMRTSYPNSTMTPLLVGIAGGVPTLQKHDVRLGDVVISTPSPEHPAILQYDYGKTVRDGVLDQKGTLNKPQPALLAALSHFRSQLSPIRTKVSNRISEALRHYFLSERGFARPPADTDILFGLDGQQEYRVRREPRSHMDPEIHYGCIASGNQVIKDASTRDRIALPADILCFEMEAAGVMDYVPCLVIRGICDYCDAHKSKSWQPYAALTAAAVAKEILTLTTTNQSMPRSAEYKIAPDERQKILNTLKFDDDDSRRATIKQALPSTCRWLLHQREVIDWTDTTKYHIHRGLLWIKGKPGAGKSTAMKYIVEHTENLYRSNQNIAIISFFYNARGSALCHSTTGMYRSLLWQIFEQIPALRSLVDGRVSLKLRTASSIWTIIALEDLLRYVVQNLGANRLLCYIDALDECSEDEIRSMMRSLEDLMDLARDNQFHVCLASRHYPHISVRRGYEFVLENQIGHAQDIRKYLDSKLNLDRHFDAEELKQKMQAKSGSIFLWIVLVVQIINREYDHGGVHRLMILLDEIPEQVEDLFRDILSRDTANLPRLWNSIRWTLFAQRPLSIGEFYYAVLFSEGEFDRQPAHVYPVSTPIMQRYILSCSKGILEETAGSNPKVQFIHETVREFLLRPGVLRTVQPGLEGFAEGISHDKLKESCCQCLLQRFEGSSSRLAAGGHREAGSADFAAYAITYVLDHAEKAQASGISQLEFVDLFLGLFLQKVSFSLHCSPHPYIPGRVFGNLHSASTNIGLKLLARSKKNLFICWLDAQRQGPDWNVNLPRFVFDAVELNNWGTFQALLQADQRGDCTITNHIDIAWFLMQQAMHKQDRSQDPSPNVLNAVFESILVKFKSRDGSIEQDLCKAFVDALNEKNAGNIRIILQLGAAIGQTKLLVEKCANLAKPNETEWPLLNAASSEGHLEIMQLVVEKGANLETPDDNGRTPVNIASSEGHLEIVRLLVEKGANLETPDIQGWTPLNAAVRNKHLEIIKLLISKGASSIAPDNRGEPLLFHAVRNGQLEVAKILLHNQFEDSHMLSEKLEKDFYRRLLSTVDHHGRDVFHHAARSGDVKMLKCLVGDKPLPNTEDRFGRSILDYAIMSGVLEMVKEILELYRRDEILIKSSSQWSVLHWACRDSSYEILRLLIGAKSQGWVVRTCKPDTWWSPLDIAIYWKNTKLVTWDGGVLDYEALQSTLNSAGNPYLTIGSSARSLRSDLFEPSYRVPCYSCNGCFSDIYGLRFYCKSCSCFDYCLMCKHGSDLAHPQHAWGCTKE